MIPKSLLAKWLLHQTSIQKGFFRVPDTPPMLIETVEHDLWVLCRTKDFWDNHFQGIGLEEHGIMHSLVEKIEEPNQGTRKMFVDKSALFRIFLGSPGKVPQQVKYIIFLRQETIGFGIYRQSIDEEISEHDAEIVPGQGWWMLFVNETPCTQRVPQEKRSEGSNLDLVFWEWHSWEIGSYAYICNVSMKHQDKGCRTTCKRSSIEPWSVGNSGSFCIASYGLPTAGRGPTPNRQETTLILETWKWIIIPRGMWHKYFCRNNFNWNNLEYLISFLILTRGVQHTIGRKFWYILYIVLDAVYQRKFSWETSELRRFKNAKSPVQ